MMLIGRRKSSTTWHLVRAPYENEGVVGETIGPRDQHIMSLCSLVWEIEQLRRGEPTCAHCKKQLQIVEGLRPPPVPNSKFHRARQRVALLRLV